MHRLYLALSVALAISPKSIASGDEMREVVLGACSDEERLYSVTSNRVLRIVDAPQHGAAVVTKVPLPAAVPSDLVFARLTVWGERRVLVITGTRIAGTKKLQWSWHAWDGKAAVPRWSSGLIDSEGLHICESVWHMGGDSMQCVFSRFDDGQQVFIVYRNECFRVGSMAGDSGALSAPFMQRMAGD